MAVPSSNLASKIAKLSSEELCSFLKTQGFAESVTTKLFGG